VPGLAQAPRAVGGLWEALGRGAAQRVLESVFVVEI